MEFGHDKGGGSPLGALGDYPLLTPVTSELLLHVKAFQILFTGEQPMMIPIRPTDKGKLRFFCGDASREGSIPQRNFDLTRGAVGSSVCRRRVESLIS